MLVFKNIFSFGLTWSAYQWLLQNGIMNTFLIVASIQVVICLLSIPMCTSTLRTVLAQVFHRLTANRRHLWEVESTAHEAVQYSEIDPTSVIFGICIG